MDILSYHDLFDQILQVFCDHAITVHLAVSVL